MFNYELKWHFDDFVADLRQIQPLPEDFQSIFNSDHMPRHDLVTGHLIRSLQFLLVPLTHLNHEYLQVMTLKVESGLVWWIHIRAFILITQVIELPDEWDEILGQSVICGEKFEIGGINWESEGEVLV